MRVKSSSKKRKEWPKKTVTSTLVAAPPFIAGFTKIGIKRRLVKESYWDFCKLFWNTIVPEPPVWNWHMEVMANALQRVCEPVFRMEPKKYDLIFNVPPGSSKSTLCSIMLLPWCWTRMPSCRLIGGSFDADLSFDLGNRCRRVVKSEEYKECFPEIEIRDDQDTKSFFANYQGGERRATSVGARIVGRHAHIHVVDDPIDPMGVRSDADAKSVSQWMGETLPSRCVDQSVTPLILVMQRLGVEDPTAERLNKTKGVPVKHYCFPAELANNVKPKKYREKYKKGLLDPKRFPRRILEIKQEELTSYGYAGQFAQRPIPLSGGMFHVDKLIVSSPPTTIKEFQEVVRFWDKAATEDDGAYTCGVLVGMMRNPLDSPRFWILDVIRGRWDTHTRERYIRQTAAMDGAIWGWKLTIGMEQEPGSGGKDSVLYSISSLAGYKVYAERPTGDKFERAVPFSDQVNAGNAGVKLAPWTKNYVEEMQYFGPACKFKDQIDGSSGAFNRLTRKKAQIGAGGF